ncbi:MAG: YbhN family protein [Actinomycetes bacterium]
MTAPVLAAPPPAPAAGRSRWYRAVVAALVAVVLLAMTVQLAAVDLEPLLARVRWWAVPAAVGATAASLLGAAWNLVGFSPVPLTLRRALSAQLAGTALKVVTPASVGTVAVNARVVQRSGAGAAPAVVAVAASQVAQVAVTGVVLGAVALLPVTGPAPTVESTRTPLTVALAVGAAAVVLAMTRRWWWRLVPLTTAVRFAEVRPQLLAVVRRPRRLVAGLGGCVVLTGGLAGALWASVQAVGGSLTPLAVVVVLLAGSAVGSSVPTPAGVGGVEAAMTAGLVAAGVPLAQAAPAVLLYRLATFWLLVPLGALAAGGLRRRGLL